MLVYQFLQELSVTLTLDEFLKVYLGLYSLGLEYSRWYDVVDWVCCPWRGKFPEGHLAKVLVLNLAPCKERVVLWPPVVATVV